MRTVTKRVLPALMAVAFVGAAAQIPNAPQPHAVSLPSAPPAPRPAVIPILPHISVAPHALVAGSHSAPGGGEVGAGTLYPHLSQQDLYQGGGFPVELFQSFTDSQQVDLGDFALKLHLPFLQSSLSMGGGDVQMSGGMITLARSAGLAEAHLDLASPSGRFGIRVQGRAVYYRSPLMATPWISTANWVVTERPALSAYYHF